MLPLLETIADGKEYSNRQVAEILVARLALSDEEVQQMLPSGAQTIFNNRLGWAKAYLKRAGLLESPSRGSLLVTDTGRDVVNQQPNKVNIRFLKQFPDFDWHRAKKPDQETV